MRIVFSIDHIYLHGGAEKVLTEKSNYFADELNYEVFILTTQQQKKPPCYPLSDNVKLVDLAIQYDREKSYLNISNLRKVFRHFKKQLKTINEINPDFIIVVNYAFDFYWIPFIHKNSKKIKEFHGSQFGRKDSITKSLPIRAKKWVQLQIEKRYDALVVLNPDEQKFFKSDNTTVIPNPIHIPDSQSKLDKRKVLAAGRIAPVKGFERLIKAWTLVVMNHPDWELHIYGDEYLNTRIELDKQIKELGIESNVQFKGVVNNMTEIMLDYSLYLMTSHTECFPMVLLESLSVGLPIVAFDVPTGPRNIITNNEDGILIENNNIQEFATAVSGLIENNEKIKLMGLNAKINSYRFQNENVMKTWSELFNKLIKQ